MIQVRCIKAVSGFTVNQIIDIENGVLATIDGVGGAIVSKDLGEGAKILFVVDDAVDSIGKTIRVQAPESMAKYFTYDTQIPQQNTTPPPSLVPFLSVADDLSYKTLLGTAGNYTTRINLNITNDSNGAYAVQIASQLSGGSLNESGLPATWATLTRQTNGMYYVTLPCSNTPPDYLQPFFVRFTGNTETKLGNYVVFKTDGTDPLGTDVPISSDAVPIVPELPVATYKTLLGTVGNYTTQIKLSIDNNPNGVYPIQVSSQLQGSLTNGFPNTWVTLARNNDGFYYPILPCTGTAQPLYLRFTGNTGYKSCNYVTFNADGTDPLASLVQPPTRTYPKDIVLSYWLQDCNDWLNCDNINPDFSGTPPCNPNGYVGTSNGADARIKSKMYRNSNSLNPPFYSTYHATKSIGTQVVNGVVGGVIGEADYNVTFNQLAFDKCLEYAYKCGAKAFELYFYDNDADVSEHVKLNQTTTSPYKDHVQYCYAVGSLGYNAVTTMNRIVSHLQQNRYYKIDGRAVLTIDEPSQSKFHIDRYILQTGATFINEDGGYWRQNADYNGEIRFSPATGFVQSSGSTPNSLFVEYIKSQYKAATTKDLYVITQGAYYYDNGTTIASDAVSAYSLPPSNWVNDHSYSNLITYNINTLNERFATSQNVVPVITTGFANLWAGESSPRQGYVDAATDNQIIEHMDKVKTVVKANSSKVPFVKIYSFGETAECGSSALIPRKLSNGNIDESKITAVRTAISN